MERSHYAELGVSQDATQMEIKIAFRAVASECHPDRTTDVEKHERFMRASRAYDVLYHPIPRALYDKQLALLSKCERCGGTGTVTKSRGFTQRFTVPCPSCG